MAGWLGRACMAAAWLLGWSLLQARASPLSVGSAYYRVHMNSGGVFTVTTGPDHPSGGNLNVLFGSEPGEPRTTLFSVRSFSSRVDFVQVETALAPDGYEQVLLPAPILQRLGDTGVMAFYSVSFLSNELEIMVILNVVGSTWEDSFVSVEAVVRNRAETFNLIGMRLLLDFSLDRNDGPAFQPVRDDGTAYDSGPYSLPVLNETRFTLPSFAHYRISAGDASTHAVMGSVAVGPPGEIPPPLPTQLQFVDWNRAVYRSFDYTVDPMHRGFADSAIDLQWGPQYVAGAWAEAAAAGPAGVAGKVGESREATAKTFLFLGPEQDKNPTFQGPSMDSIATPAPIPMNSPQQLLQLTNIKGLAPLAVAVISSKPLLLDAPIVVYDPGASSVQKDVGYVRYKPVPGQWGTAELIVTVSDAVGRTHSRAVMVEVVNPWISAPSFGDLGQPVLLSEGAGLQTVVVPSIRGGTPPLTLTAKEQPNPANDPSSSSFPLLFPLDNLTASYVEGRTAGSVVLRPTPGLTGSCTVALTLADSAGKNATKLLLVTVLPAASLSALPSPVYVEMNTLGETLALEGLGGAAPLLITAHADPPALLRLQVLMTPSPGAAAAIQGGSGQLLLAPLPDQQGSTVVTVTVTDALGTVASASATVQVRHTGALVLGGTRPAFDPLPDLLVASSTAVSVPVENITGSQPLRLDAALIVYASNAIGGGGGWLDVSIAYDEGGSSAQLLLSPLFGVQGVAHVTVKAGNWRGEARQSFDLFVGGPLWLDAVADQGPLAQGASFSFPITGIKGLNKPLALAAVAADDEAFTTLSAQYTAGSSSGQILATVALATGTRSTSVTVTLSDSQGAILRRVFSVAFALPECSLAVAPGIEVPFQCPAPSFGSLANVMAIKATSQLDTKASLQITDLYPGAGFPAAAAQRAVLVEATSASPRVVRVVRVQQQQQQAGGGGGASTATVHLLVPANQTGDVLLRVVATNQAFRQAQRSITLRIFHDCHVQWGDWGPCSQPCGLGIRFRTQVVISPPANGGIGCPPLTTDKGVCTLGDCGPPGGGGSCLGLCGGLGPGACACDDECSEYADCCADYAAVCQGLGGGGSGGGGAPPSCRGRCGGQGGPATTSADPPCWCDGDCAAYADCCADYEAQCRGAYLQPPDAEAGGGPSCLNLCGQSWRPVAAAASAAAAAAGAPVFATSLSLPASASGSGEGALLEAYPPLSYFLSTAPALQPPLLPLALAACHCDAKCLMQNDCCPDYLDACLPFARATSCFQRCGQGPTDGAAAFPEAGQADYDAYWDLLLNGGGGDGDQQPEREAKAAAGGECFCDLSCAYHGDCCVDWLHFCPSVDGDGDGVPGPLLFGGPSSSSATASAGGQSCLGRCGSHSAAQGQCYCDPPQCQRNGDCCQDVSLVCTTPHDFLPSQFLFR